MFIYNIVKPVVDISETPFCIEIFEQEQTSMSAQELSRSRRKVLLSSQAVPEGEPPLPPPEEQPSQEVPAEEAPPIENGDAETAASTLEARL